MLIHHTRVAVRAIRSSISSAEAVPCAGTAKSAAILSSLPQRASASCVPSAHLSQSQLCKRFHSKARRDIGAFLGGAALTTLAPPANADVKIDPNSVRTTKGGAKYVVVKEGSCPLIDPSGALGSCYLRPSRTSRSTTRASCRTARSSTRTEKKGGKPLSFRLGERQVVPGIEEVVARMKPGEEAQALIAAALAYGDKGPGRRRRRAPGTTASGTGSRRRRGR